MSAPRFLSAVCLLLVLSAPALAQEAQPDQQAMMEQYMKLMAPNENHAYLAGYAGSWDVTTTAWMAPRAEPTVSKGAMEASMILGGRYLLMKYAGTMFGQPFEGMQIVGYDTMAKKFVTFWIDNTGTAFYLTSGTRDEAAGVETQYGEWPDPMTGGSSKVKGVTRTVSSDEFVYEMYMIGDDGDEFKSLENRAVRRK